MSKFHILVKVIVLSEKLNEIPGQSVAGRITAVVESNCNRPRYVVVYVTDSIRQDFHSKLLGLFMFILFSKIYTRLVL